MIKSNGNINEVKEKIRAFYEKDVDVTVNLGRNKFARFSGKLTGVISRPVYRQPVR